MSFPKNQFKILTEFKDNYFDIFFESLKEIDEAKM